VRQSQLVVSKFALGGAQDSPRLFLRQSMPDMSTELESEIVAAKDVFFRVNLKNVKFVLNNLKFVYYSVIGSENLLVCAIEQLKSEKEDNYNETLLKYFASHLEEERDHVKWLLDDLTTHGVELDDGDEDAMAMVGSQYYMIFHLHPSCLLGYLAVVEGTPTPIEEIEKMERIYGRKLFRFARFHALKDRDHKIELFDVINKAPTHLRDGFYRSARNCLKHMERAARHWG
jgi:hypothetical protein